MTPPIAAFMLSRMLARSAAREFACWMLMGTRSWKGEPISHAARLLRQGAVLAVKGLGGYHLACNALDP